MNSIERIIDLINEGNTIEKEISCLQEQKKIIEKDIEQFMSEIKPSQKKFLDDKIIERFSDETKKRIESYRKYMNDIASGICNSYQIWNIFDPYTDKYTITNIDVDDRENEGLFIKVIVRPEKPSGHISLMTVYDLYMSEWFNIDEFENCD